MSTQINSEQSEKKQEKCEFCGRKLTFWNKQFKKHQGKTICSSCSWKNVTNEFKEAGKGMAKEFKEAKDRPSQITETKATCQACDNTWFYGKSDSNEQFGNSMANCGKGMMCCTCSPLALFIPDKKVTDLNKCPKCGSRAIKKETVTHNV